MRDPLDQWAEGGTPPASQGDSPGRNAVPADGWNHAVPPGAPAPAPGMPGPPRRGSAHDPAHVQGPLWRGQPQQPPVRQPAPWESGSYPAAAPGRPGAPAGHPGAPVPSGVPAPGSSAAGPGGVGPLPGEEFTAGLQAPHPRRRPKRRRPLRRAAVVLLVTVLAGSIGTYAWAETRLQRDVDMDRFASRPPAGEGTTYLIVGSDSREGLSQQQRENLNTGVFGGRRTDSMILMHKGRNGTTMVSLPRDSWVTIPGYTRPSTGKRSQPEENKLNAAFSLGGPELLISTIEQNTGVRIDHYAEIGFAGFVNIVDAVGGVPMCIERDIKDRDSGADLRKGCQNLDGAEALAFVRQRKQEAEGDLGRTQNQQKFLSALAKKAAAADTVLDPSDLYPALSAGLDTLVVDQGMSMQALTAMFRSVQGVSGGGGTQVNVPTTGNIKTPKGDAVRWNEKQAKKLFDQIRQDRPVTAREK